MLVSMSFKWFENIYLSSNQPTSVANAIHIKRLTKMGTGIYIVDTENDSTQSGILSLNQSFNEGWIGLTLKINNRYSVNKLGHYIFNGWANAWEVPAGANNIIIIYWPQLAVFGGYLLLIGTFISLVIRWLQHKR